MYQRISALILFLALGVSVTSCCALVPAFPDGAYIAHTTGQDYVLDFTRDGTYSAVLAGSALITDGSYRRVGNAIIFAADPPCTVEATYEWTLEDDRLTFELKGEDRCSDRRGRLQDTVYTCISCT